MNHTINTPITMDDGTIIPAFVVWSNDDQQYFRRIKYPKVGKSHYYSMVNFMGECWDHQYPSLEYALRMQTRGTITFHPITNPINHFKPLS